MPVTVFLVQVLLSPVVGVIATRIRHQHRARGPVPDNAKGHTGLEAASGGVFSSDPFALSVGCLERVVAKSATAESGAELGALDLIELFDPAPGFVADGSG